MTGLQDNPPCLWLALEWPLFFRVAVDMPCGQDYQYGPSAPSCSSLAASPDFNIREREGSFLRAVFVREMLPPLSLELDSERPLSPSCCNHFINKICNRHRRRVGERVSGPLVRGNTRKRGSLSPTLAASSTGPGTKSRTWQTQPSEAAGPEQAEKIHFRGREPCQMPKHSLKPTSSQEQGPCEFRHSSPIHSAAPSRWGQVKIASCTPTHGPEDHWPKSAQTLLVGFFLNTFINQC